MVIHKFQPFRLSIQSSQLPPLVVPASAAARWAVALIIYCFTKGGDLCWSHVAVALRSTSGYVTVIALGWWTANRISYHHCLKSEWPSRGVMTCPVVFTSVWHAWVWDHMMAGWQHIAYQSLKGCFVWFFIDLYKQMFCQSMCDRMKSKLLMCCENLPYCYWLYIECYLRKGFINLQILQILIYWWPESDGLCFH